MSIYLSHTSLRKAWALIGQKGLTTDTLCDVRRPLDAARGIRDIRRAGYFDHGFLSHIAEPIDLLVPSNESRVWSKHVSPHLCLRDLPEGSFRRIREGVYLLTPALNYVQMGQILTLGQLTAYGIELCGRYSLAPGTDRGFIDRGPLTTKKELELAVSSGVRIHGTGKARRALAFVEEGSRSPRETILAVLLCLPPDEGAYSMPTPELNGVVALSADAAQIAGRSALHPDLCWRWAKVIVEYDSDGFHLEEGQVMRDVDRKDAFARDGWRVITITKDRLWKPEVFDRIVREDLSPRLDVECPPATRDFLQKRRALRKEIFDFDPYEPTRATARGRLRQA